MSALVLLIASAGMAQAKAVGARHQAQSAADLVALAGAAAIGRDVDPCITTARIASANAVTLTACRVVLAPSGRSGRVAVEVALPVEFRVGGFATVGRAAAQATAERLP
jgi:hypothetical protein